MLEEIPAQLWGLLQDSNGAATLPVILGFWYWLSARLKKLEKKANTNHKAIKKLPCQDVNPCEKLSQHVKELHQ